MGVWATADHGFIPLPAHGSGFFAGGFLPAHGCFVSVHHVLCLICWFVSYFFSHPIMVTASLPDCIYLILTVAVVCVASGSPITMRLVMDMAADFSPEFSPSSTQGSPPPLPLDLPLSQSDPVLFAELVEHLMYLTNDETLLLAPLGAPSLAALRASLGAVLPQLDTQIPSGSPIPVVLGFGFLKPSWRAVVEPVSMSLWDELLLLRGLGCTTPATDPLSELLSARL